MKRISILFSLFLYGHSVACAQSSAWLEWRGPGGLGHAAAKSLPISWSETDNVNWKTSIPGRGWSTPVIANGKIWLTTAHETEASEAEKKERLKTNTANQPLTVLSKVALHVICIDQKSGKILHDLKVLEKKNPQWVHQLNSYASPTPVLAPGRLYAHFGSYGTACIDTRTADVLWRNQDLWVMHENGPGSSPVRWKNRLIFHMDGSDKQYIVALDTDTGKPIWQTERSGKMHDNPQLKKAYGTPLLTEHQGQTVLLSPAANWLYAYDPESGKELWKVDYEVLGFSNVARPVLGAGKVFVSTCFIKSEMLAINLDDEPDIAWRYKKGVPSTPSPIFVDDAVYFTDEKVGFLTCLDAATGEMRWKARLGGKHCGSPIYGGGHLYFSGQDGTTTVIKPGPEYNEVAKNRLDGRIMASPAVADGSVYLRTDKALYRIDP